MGVLAACRSRRVYLDSNIFIHAVGGDPTTAEAVGELFDLMDAAQTAAVTSELTLAEVLVRPLKLDRDDLFGIYEELPQPSPGLTVSPIDRATLVAAAHLRTQLGLRLPDAIHVATALHLAASCSCRNDRKIRLPVTMVLLPLR